MLTVGSMDSVKFRGIQNNERLQEKNSLGKHKAISNPGFANKVPLATLQAYSSNISFEGAPIKPRVDYTRLEKVTKISVDEMVAKKSEELKSAIVNTLKGRENPTEMRGWIDLPSQMLKKGPNGLSKADEMKQFAIESAKDFDDVVVIGIGGSELPPKAIVESLTHSKYNMLTPEQRAASSSLKGQVDRLPRIHFINNPRSKEVKELFDILDPKKTKIAVISKSGGTAEPGALFIHIQELMAKKVGKKNLKNHIFAITDANAAKSSVKAIADKNGYKTFVIPDDVGGRFSYGTEELVPAAMAGVDIHGFLRGQRACTNDFKKTVSNIRNNQAGVQGLVEHTLNNKAGLKNTVIADTTGEQAQVPFAWAQTEVESLGKAQNAKGETVNASYYVIPEKAPSYHHSTQQGYQEGGHHNIHVNIRTEDYGKQTRITKHPELVPENLGSIKNATFEDLLTSCVDGVEDTYVNNGRPVIDFVIHKNNAYNLGYEMQHFMFKTGVKGQLEGLGINTYLQPGVEGAKKISKALVSKKSADRELADAAKKAAKQNK